MSAILPSLKIDLASAEKRYFLPYQIAWIHDDAQMRLVDKSVRIGWTYADAFKNVRKRLRNKKRDYLFTTKDQSTALEYLATCKQFCEIFNFSRSILSHGVEAFRVPVFKEGRDTGFTEEVKMGVIKFDNGSRILAFSSNPNALRAYGGDVGLDEFAYHPAANALWMSAQGRVTWGYDIGVWSSANGVNSLHYSFSREAREGKGGWNYYRVTMEDAVELGLVEKIAEVSGKQMSREEFIADCKKRARFEEVYQADYMCNPRGGNTSVVPWSSIERCQQEYELERVHLEAQEVCDAFGAYHLGEAEERERSIQSFLRRRFSKVLQRGRRCALGFDVAASGRGDLCVIYVDELVGRNARLVALLTCRTEDWQFIKCCLWFFMQNLVCCGAGDETGLGRQICWEAGAAFAGRFCPVNFSGKKSDLGFALMNQLDAGEKQIPSGLKHRDIATDYFGLSKQYVGQRWVFSEGTNLHNNASHCDIAWAGALATEAARQGEAGASGSIVTAGHILLGKSKLSGTRMNRF